MAKADGGAKEPEKRGKKEARICGDCGEKIPRPSLKQRLAMAFFGKNRKPMNNAIVCDGCLTQKLKYGDWTLSEEREFFENLFVGRFNFFLLVFSLFVTAGFSSGFTRLSGVVFFVKMTGTGRGLIILR